MRKKNFHVKNSCPIFPPQKKKNRKKNPIIDSPPPTELTYKRNCKNSRVSLLLQNAPSSWFRFASPPLKLGLLITSVILIWCSVQIAFTLYLSGLKSQRRVPDLGRRNSLINPRLLLRRAIGFRKPIAASQLR